MVAKRLLDLLLCCVALPIALPLVVICALAVRWSSPGPVLFRQKRIGMNRRSFEILKFRSMYVNAPDLRNSDGSTFNGVQDTRVTLVGRFLRKTSLDEIPQLINVLRGEMSFVGPRPDPSRSYRPASGARAQRAALGGAPGNGCGVCSNPLALAGHPDNPDDLSGSSFEPGYLH
jgi:undecaprenyl phosphate N,N'-diacetylbacillosamine 1-phosphate transferase